MRAAKDALALAADLPLPEAIALYEQVRAVVGVVKVGLSLFVEHGPAAVQAFTDRGARVFLDLKLHDIPNTVQLAAQAAGRLGVSYLTVHAGGGEAMLRAAVEGAHAGASSRGAAAPTILSVTVLTSMDDPTLLSVGVEEPLVLQVERLAALSAKAGVGGLVCSAREVSEVRRVVGDGFVLCTPGIRPRGASTQDQARVETPAAAIAAGASLLVVGRPITQAKEPLVAARAIHDEVEAAVRAA
ncbi:MAG: orotidine-5'-phosphate decarboxylase [Myxococcaceae bacterium]|nr:orotidine-5'-phosphate decarboxylase [Myxococcaceae bacterium]MCA3012731.1 orotidine-5'-phosphate decarboxylase [Myxococcaceae bacterium]